MGSMLLFAVLLATSFWSCVDKQAVPEQTPGQQAQLRGTSASMSCKLESRDTVNWYKQLPGEQPKRILYDSGGTPEFDSTSDRNRMKARSDPAQPIYHLTIYSLTPRDSAFYFCAYWYFERTFYYNKVFGSGTKLLVSEKASSPPANSEILQKKHENQTTYVCLIEKFYPEVIRVTWTDDEKEVTDNVVKGDTWQSPKDDEYSIASWLTVPAENKDKKYYCKYEHEKKQASLSTYVPGMSDSVKTASQEEDCGKVFSRDQLMHRTAYLVYIILLLKSSMYYLILLFFIYKMWASTKHQGKKA